MAGGTSKTTKNKYPQVPGLEGNTPTPAAKVDLQAEIDMLREILRRVNQLAVDVEELNDLLKVLEGAGRTGARLADMLRVQRDLVRTASGEEDSSKMIAMLEKLIQSMPGKE